MYYTKDLKNYISERKVHHDAVVRFILLLLVAIVSLPLVVYLMSTASHEVYKVGLLTGVLLLFSIIVAKLLVHFFEHYEDENNNRGNIYRSENYSLFE